MPTFKKTHFAVRDGRRFCLQPSCKAAFALTTGATTLEAHFIREHKDIASQLKLAEKARGGSAGAAAPAIHFAAPAAATTPVSSQSSAGSVVYMADAVQNCASSSAAGDKRALSALSSVASSPAAKRVTVMVAGSAQRSLHSAFMSGGNAALAEATALFFATNHIAYHVADSSSFLAFCSAVRCSNTAPPKRRVVKSAVTQLALNMKADVLQRLRSSSAPITVAIDGWTNVRQTKVTNIVLICCGVAYYWRSIPNTYDANTAEWLDQQISPLLRELAEYGVRFSALVADNEAVNDALWARLLEPFPFLIRVPCAAHTIQLVVQQIMVIRRFNRSLSTARDIIRRFEKNKADRLQLRHLQNASGQREYVLVKACDTRWNSELYCCLRLLKLRSFVNIIFPQDDSVWTELELLCAFLRPFQTATDVLQRDSSTLFDIWLQKRALEHHIAAMKSRVGVTVVKAALAAVKHRWNKQVNKEATHAVALLSLISDISSINAEEQNAAKQFILRFGVSYLRFFGLSDAEAESDDDLRAALLNQLGCFSGRRGLFVTLEENISCVLRSEKSKCTALDIWDLYACSLATVAKALLTITASEAAVERTFSMQGGVHTKRRNRLLDDSVQNEMFVKFNRRALDRAASAPELPSFRCVDLSPDIDLEAAAAVDSDADTEAESLAEPVAGALASAEPASSAIAASAAAAAVSDLPRSQSMLEGDMRSILEEYIAEHGITLVSIANRRYWTGDRQNALQVALPPGGYVVKEAIAAIKTILEEQND